MKLIECYTCGKPVECWGFTNECTKCGALYNFAGQALRPARDWESDTGEAFDAHGNYIIGSGDPDFDPEG